jgi:hypothetical protein
MRAKTFLIILLSFAPLAFAGPRLSLSGDLALGIPIGDMAGDDLDTGYKTIPVFRGALAFQPFPPVLMELGAAYTVRSGAKTGIDEGEVSWRGTDFFAGAGVILNMGLLMPHLSAGASYYYISRYDAEEDPENENYRRAKKVSAHDPGFYIDLGLQYFLYERLAVSGGLRYDHVFTAGKPARIFDVHGGVEYYLF